MEKILLAIDAEQLDVSAIDFACYVAGLTRSKLTGVFIGNLQQHEPVAASNERSVSLQVAVNGRVAEDGVWPRSFDESARLFENICSNRNIRCEVMYLDTKQAAGKLITESRFADLVILKGETSFSKKLEGIPSHFTGEVLSGAECPVLVAPPECNSIDEVIFAYDGSKSSVFAIRQFTYLFPRLSDKRTMLLEVAEEPGTQLTAKDKIIDLLKVHYSGIGYRLLHGNPTEELLSYLMHKKNSIVVMGAYGKSLFAKLPKHSTATPLIKKIHCPFFITHC